MEKVIVPRTKVLQKILTQFSHIHEPKTVEVVGEAGCGKTTLIQQIDPYLNQEINSSKVIYVQAITGKMPAESIIDSLKAKQIAFPKSLENGKLIEREANLRTALELIYSIRENFKQLVIVVVDEFHVLSEEEQKNYRTLFSPQIVSGKYGLILVGRPGWENAKPIKIPNLNLIQIKKWLEIKFSFNLNKDQQFIADWLKIKTDGNPFYLEQLIQSCESRGVFNTQHYIDYKVLNSIKLPTKILELVSFNYELYKKSKLKKEILFQLALVNEGLTLIEISKINNISPKTLTPHFEIAILQGWFKSTSERYTLIHPLQKEYILLQISKAGNSINQSEKVQLLIQLSKKSQSVRKEVLIYCDHLIQQKNYKLAIDYLLTIYKKNEYPEVTARLGSLWTILQNLSQAKRYVDTILEHPKFRENPVLLSETVHYLIKSNELHKAKQVLKNCFRKKKVIPPKKRYFLYSVSMWIAVREFDIKKMNEIISSLKIVKDYDKEAKIHYFKSILYLPRNYKGTIKPKKYFKAATDFAIKLEDYNLAADYEHSILAKHMLNYDHAQVLKSHQKIKYFTTLIFSPGILKYADTLVAVSYSFQKEYLKAYIWFKKNYTLNQLENGIITENILSTLLKVFFNAGKLSSYKYLHSQTSKYEKYTKMTTNSIRVAKLKHFVLLQDWKSAQTELITAMSFSQEIKHEHSMHVLNILSFPLTYKKSPVKALEMVKSGLVFFVKKNLSINSDWLYITGREILRHDPEKLNSLINLFPAPQSNDDEFYNSALQLQAAITRKKYTLAITLLNHLENYYKGQYLVIYHELYNAFSNAPDFPKVIKNRAKKMAAMLHYILHYQNGQSDSITLPNHKGFGLERFVYEWCSSLNKDKIFPMEELNAFTNDPIQIDEFESLLSLWDIKVSEESQKKSQEEININLMGKPKIVYNRNHINSPGKLSKAPARLLYYFLLNTNNNTQNIKIENLVKDLFGHRVDQSSVNRRINTLISRINKEFNTGEEKLIFKRKNEIYLNECFEISTDTDKFTLMKNMGDSYSQSNDWNKARINFEVCFHFYTGMLLKGFDDSWLERFRSFYLEQYIEVMHSLIAVYEELEVSDNIYPLLLGAKSIHPEVEEFDELLEAYK